MKDIKYQELTQIPKTDGYSLISNLGGTMSLFIGLEFLYLGDFIEFIIDVCRVLLR